MYKTPFCKSSHILSLLTCISVIIGTEVIEHYDGPVLGPKDQLKMFMN